MGVAATTLISLVEIATDVFCRTFTKAGTSRVDTFSCIYVTDGGTGEIKIFRGSDYAPIGSLKFLHDADSIGCDLDTKHLYVTNGGGRAHLQYAAAVSFLVFLLKAGETGLSLVNRASSRDGWKEPERD